MTTDDILRMAREAGWPASVLHPHGPGVDTGECLLVPTLQRFAALVAATEREQCAKVCDVVGYGHEIQQGAELAFELAATIRARSAA